MDEFERVGVFTTDGMDRNGWIGIGGHRCGSVASDGLFDRACTEIPLHLDLSLISVYWRSFAVSRIVAHAVSKTGLRSLCFLL